MGIGRTNVGGSGGLNLKIVGGTSRPGGSDTLTWDGNTEGLESFELGGITYYKVSEIVPTYTEICAGGSITGTDGNYPMTLEFTADQVSANEALTYFYISPHQALQMLVVNEAGYTGIYFSSSEGVYICALKINGYTFGGGSVKDNTIWVNTEAEINGYAFSATEPESPVAGMVWFVTGTTASAPLNIGKKNIIMVYPNTCYQYIGGAWISKTAMTYLDGEWVNWTLYLYQAGETDTGLVALGWKYENSSYGTVVPTITYGADSVVLQISGSSGSYSGVVYFPEKVNLTGKNRIVADASLAGSINSYSGARPEGLYVWNEIGSGYFRTDAVASAEFGEIGDKVLAIDVSSLTGEYYIGFGMRYETGAQTITIREVYVE